MRKDHNKRAAMTLLAVGALFCLGCHKRVASAPPLPATSAPQPVRAAEAKPTPPPPSPPPAAARPTAAPATPSLSELFQQNVKDAFFNFDKADVRSDAREVLTKDAEFLRDNPSVSLEVDGHCDDRGGEEYNLALGDRRATAVKQYLVAQGIPQNRIQTVSLGKEHPFCSSESEDCWQQNRRGHLAMPK